MKKLLSFLCLLCFVPFLQAQQTVYTPDNLPKVHLQNKYRYLCDPEGIIGAAATDSIDRMLYRLEQQTGIETVAAVVPSIGQAECFDFCHELLNSWGVGKKGKNNGLVILLVIDQRCIQFYTGYGLEGSLPDAICKRIQTQTMLPYLRNGRWSEGMVAGVRATCARLDGSMENDSDMRTPGGGGGWLPVVVVFLFVVAALVVGVAAQRRKTRCPHCKKHKLQRAGSQTVSFRNGVKTEDVTYICQNCGHVITRREQHGRENNRGQGGGWGGPIIFGGGFGGFGGLGGGFSGGSFGGGRGGGGGAGTRF